MLDVSYAAAWQLGRLMAVRDKSFAFALYRWKQEAARKTFHAHYSDRIHQMPHIQLLRDDTAQPLLAEQIRTTAFQFVADNLKDILLALDGKEAAR